LHAAIVLPASVLAMTGSTRMVDGLADPLLHAHEMLLGFALAVVAGNQLGTLRGRFVVAMLLLWIGARAAMLIAPWSLIAAALNAAFAATLAFRAVPRLLGAAKKWRNRALPAVIAGLCVAAAGWQIAHQAGDAGVPRTLVLATVLLFATLMLFMGGRIIAPAIAGQLYRQGGRLDARVQPRLEAALLVSGGLAAAIAAVPGMMGVCAMAAIVAGILALVRMGRWRLWALQRRPDLLCLSAGYGWLGIGLVVLGAAIAGGRHETAAIHLITVGALGTLTFTVMATLWLAKFRRPPARSMLIVCGTALIAGSTAFRVLGAFHPEPWLLVSAACWSAAYSVLLALFWRVRTRQ
jgi:uncharacterized protein involved in response to NO